MLVDGVAFAGHAKKAFGSAGQGDGPRAMGLTDAATSAAFMARHADGRTKTRGNTFARGDGGHCFHCSRFRVGGANFFYRSCN